MQASSLIARIDPIELIAIAPPLVAWQRGLVDNEEAVAKFMYRGGAELPRAAARPPGGADERPDRSYWEAVRVEMHLFLCTDEPRYEKLKASISSLEKPGTAGIVGLVAATVSAHLAIPAALLGGFVAICLHGVAKLGKEAYCRYAADERPSDEAGPTEDDDG